MRESKNKPIVLLGNFDGVHLGHRALVKKARELADENGELCTVWSFGVLPKLNHGDGFADITLPALRSAWLRTYGADEVIFDSFERVRNFSPREFFEKVILGELDASGCVCGFNYRFGRGGAGDCSDLAALCREYGLRVNVVDEVKVTLGDNDMTVSSTKIRELLEVGNVKDAGILLGHSHVTGGEVVGGKKLGRTAGFPTANQRIDKNQIKLPTGVYATYCRMDGGYYPSVTNIGRCPTVTENGDIVSETHIIGYSGDLYGKDLRVGYLDRIRGEKKFGSADELFAEIRRNSETAERIFREREKEIFIPRD